MSRTAPQIPAYESFPESTFCPGKPECPRRDFPSTWTGINSCHQRHLCIHTDCDSYRQTIAALPRKERMAREALLNPIPEPKRPPPVSPEVVARHKAYLESSLYKTAPASWKRFRK